MDERRMNTITFKKQQNKTHKKKKSLDLQPVVELELEV